MTFLKKNYFYLTFTLLLAFPARSFSFWGDGGAGWANAAYLAKILTENIRRYQQLRMMIDQAKNHKQYLKLINSGLENSLGLLGTLPVSDERVLAQLKTFRKSFKTIMDLYGQIPTSKMRPLHTLHDQTVAESLKMVNSFKQFTKKQEHNSALLKVQARSASPKGAARMQVEASSNILKSLNQLIRLNGQMLKMQSELLAMNNKSSKDGVLQYQRVDKDLRHGLKNLNLSMGLVKY